MSPACLSLWQEITKWLKCRSAAVSATSFGVALGGEGVCWGVGLGLLLLLLLLLLLTFFWVCGPSWGTSALREQLLWLCAGVHGLLCCAVWKQTKPLLSLLVQIFITLRLSVILTCTIYLFVVRKCDGCDFLTHVSSKRCKSNLSSTGCQDVEPSD